MMYHKKKRGAVLLMTLVVALVLTVFVAKNFENTSQELVALKNEETDFKIETLSRSILKIFLIIMKEMKPENGRPGAGANLLRDVFQILNKQNIPIPFFPDDIPDLFVTKPEIWSMDHYFYIGEKLSSEGQNTLRKILLNEIDASTDTDIDIEELKDNAIDNICNWLGSTRCPGSQSERLGTEILVAPKKELLDTDSELKFLIANIIRKQNIEGNAAELEQNIEDLPIRFMYVVDPYTLENGLSDSYSPSSLPNIGKLNLNMLTEYSQSKLSVEGNLNSFFDLVKYTENQPECTKDKLDCNKFLSDQLVTSTIEDQLKISSDPDKEEDETEEDKFAVDDLFSSFYRLGEDHFKYNTPPISDYPSFFNHRSNLVGMRFNIELGETVRTVTTHLRLIYIPDNKTAQPDRIEVLYYKVI